MAAYTFVATNHTADATMNHSYFFTYERREEGSLRRRKIKIKNDFTVSVSVSLSGFCSTHIKANAAYIDIW